MAHNVLWPKKTFFYPFGNTPPVCFTQDLAPELKADVLLLACGDPRSILYTVYADLARAYRPMDFTCCDWEPAVLARNILLLTMAADGVSSTNMWCIFYDFFLDKASYDILLAQCRTLIQLSSDIDVWQESKYGRYLRFCTKHTLTEVRRLWTSYLGIDDLADAEMKSLRASFVSGMQKVRNMGASGSVRPDGPLPMSFLQAARNTHKDFWSTGITPSSLKQDHCCAHINPTFAFCQAGRVFNVHYGSNPLKCFHLAPALTSIKGTESKARPATRDFTDLAMSQISFWCAAFKSRVSSDHPNITIRFFVGESLSFCHSLRYCEEGGVTKTGFYTLPWGGTQTEFNDCDYSPSAKCRAPLKFNVIDTSNLADHAGLLNLLIVTTPLLLRLPWSVLHTNTLLPSSTAGVPSSVLASSVLADIPTLSMILGVAPSSSLFHFTTHSNKHEILASSAFSGQLLENIAWRMPPCSVPGTSLLDPISEHVLLVPDADKLAHFLFSVYRKMFPEDDFQGLFQNQNKGLDRVLRQIAPHYMRQSLAIFFRLVKDKVEVNWSQVMTTFFNLLESSKQFALSSGYYQDLSCHLHLYGLCTLGTMSARYVRALNPSHPCFTGWKDIPSVVCVVLKVPRSALRILEDIEADDIKTPLLRCASRVWNGCNFHSSIQPIFGDISVSRIEGETQVDIVEDDHGWQGSSPLVVTFYMPTWIILCNEPSEVSVGVYLRSDPSNFMLLMSKLGLENAIYSTTLSDEEHVQVIRHRPNNAVEIERLRELSMPENMCIDKGIAKEKATLNFDDAGTRVTTMTIRRNILDSKGAKALSEGANVKMKQRGDTCLETTFDGFLQKFTYPFLIRSNQAKCRIARKSSYIEIEAPVRSSFDDFLDLSLNPFPVICYHQTVNNLNMHYVNLDLSPALNLPMTQDRLEWLRLHLGCAFSREEKYMKGRPDQKARGVLVNVKDSITAIFMGHAGLYGSSKQPNVFGLYDPQNVGCYALIFVNGIKLDLPSHTILVDACIIPLYDAIMAKIFPALHRLHNQGVSQINTLDDEAKVWRLLLPVLAERCRNWEHSLQCKYLSKGIPVALEGPVESPLCNCGKGKNLGSFGKLTEWKELHAEATRIAIGPLFSFSFMEDTMTELNESLEGATASEMSRSPVSSPASSSPCSKCGGPGKPNLSICSRCKKAKYCSRECQTSHWKVHKRLCVAS